MNRLLATFLAVFLVACPSFCRAGTFGCCAEQVEAPDDHTPAPEPERNESTSCICDGALRDSDAATMPIAAAGVDLWPAIPPDLLVGPPSPDRDDRRAHRRGDRPRRVHLLLRHLRC